MKSAVFFLFALLLSGTGAFGAQGLRGWVTGAAFNPKGGFLLAVSGESEVTAFEPESLAALFSLTAPGGEKINALAISPDGGTVVCAGDEGSVFAFSLPSGELVLNARAHHYPVKSAAFSPGGNYFATGSYGGEITVWNAASLSPVKTIFNEDECGEFVAFAASGAVAAAGGACRKIYLYEAETGRLTGSLGGHYAGVTALAASPDGELLASGDSAGLIVVHDMRRRKVKKSVRTGDWNINAFAFSASSSPVLAAARNDGQVSVYDAGSLTRLRDLRPYLPGALACSFSPDGSLLAAGYMLGALRVFDWAAAAVSVREAGSVVRDARGKTAGTLKTGERYSVSYSSFTAYGVKIEGGGMAGFVSPDAVYDEDLIPPYVMPAQVQDNNGTRTVVFAALDDVGLAYVRVEKLPVKPVDMPYDCGNLRACKLYSVKFSKNSRVQVEVTDIAGKSTSTVLSAATAVPDAGPYYLSAAASADAPVLSDRAAKQPLYVIKKGEPIDTAGYKKGWYYLRDGNWLYDAGVTAR